MSRNQLTLFSYEILGLVGRTGAGAHDLLRLARRGRILDWGGREPVLHRAEAARASLGYLEAQTGAGQDDASAPIYTLTDARPGAGPLREYARHPRRAARR